MSTFLWHNNKGSINEKENIHLIAQDDAWPNIKRVKAQLHKGREYVIVFINSKLF